MPGERDARRDLVGAFGQRGDEVELRRGAARTTAHAPPPMPRRPAPPTRRTAPPAGARSARPGSLSRSGRCPVTPSTSASGTLGGAAAASARVAARSGRPIMSTHAPLASQRPPQRRSAQDAGAWRSLALARAIGKARRARAPVQRTSRRATFARDLTKATRDGERPAPTRARRPAHPVPELCAPRPRHRRPACRAALEKAGHTVWWDALIEGGANFASSIREALDAADVVIVLWSRSSVESDWVRDEAAQGRDRHRLVPLSIDGSQPPLGFRQYQVIDLATLARRCRRARDCRHPPRRRGRGRSGRRTRAAARRR